MKKFIIKFCTGLVFILSLASCDDFLDQTVQGQLLENEFYLSDQDALQAVNATYDILGAEYNTAWNSLYLLKTLPSDESNAGGANNGDQPGYQTLDDFTLGSLNDKVVAIWANLYATVYRANKVINNVKPENDLRKRVIAEAKVLRAFAYFELVSLWGEVPLVLEEVDASKYASTGRVEKQAIYTQIETDLTEAIAILPMKSQYSAGDKFRWSKGAAQALLGKAHLYQEEWANAVTQFNYVISSNEYALEDSVQHVFAKSGEFGIESLFELSFVNTEKYDWGNFPWSAKPESNIHIQLMGPRSDYYKPMNGDSLTGGWGMNVAKKKIYDAFVASGDENRRKVTVFSVAELKANGGDWTTDNSWDFEGYWQRKYGSFSKQTGTPTPELNYGTNFRLIRYADVLLMAAEANYRNGDEGTARTLINTVRQRKGTSLPPIDNSVTGNALFQALVTERQLELAFEGFRFLDLVRWGLAEQELGSLGFQKGKHEVMPIPYVDATSYGLPQNDGY
ncbi:RagB/SusD family nutrient uptake outer membrane protein [Chryseosolibacter indicus]|uniref:RagB/SusD family nutrient uptake outer membrane protein n=1 Tax=Chryseosolibacter indicus TaxID=2782351 RepID=A0ABS5VWX0_9BACT|nr:RagB/SusD family nutrient uptake outer membrane protein [Chryseosolibacter indicus]MBT1705731.1 RagB/SusD family nutrient uptake outer membrane protein [Chryseosolibacter indicus]